MKWFSIAITALVCVTAASAQNLTGRWTGPGSTADDGQEFVLAIAQAPGGSMTGYVQGPRADDRIVGGKLDGNNFTIDVERAGRGGAIQKLTYTGTVEGGKMKLTLPVPPGRGAGGPAAGRGPTPGAAPGGRPGGGRGGQPQVVELSRVSTETPQRL